MQKKNKNKTQATKLPPSLNSANKLKEALQTLAADAMTDDGENVLATEVLWTPQVRRDSRCV
jgi:uncharacterized membrane protein